MRSRRESWQLLALPADLIISGAAEQGSSIQFFQLGNIVRRASVLVRLGLLELRGAGASIRAEIRAGCDRSAERCCFALMLT